MKIALILIIFTIFWKQYECVECDLEPKTNEGRLRKHLLCNYDSSNRPSLTDGVISIKIKMIFKGFTFTDHEEKMTVSSWFAMSWMDDHLKWSPAEFNGINTIVEKSTNFWQPELALYNSVSYESDFCASSNCVIDSSGKVSCIPPCSHTARCYSNFKRWPFDVQNCTLHIGTWVNSGEEVDYEVIKTIVAETDLESQDHYWRLISATYRRHPGNYSAVKKTYPSIVYSFTIERHSATHAALVITPAFAFILLNLTALWITPYSIQRLMIYCLSLFSQFMFLQQLTWLVPSHGETCPDIVYFFRDCMVITTILLINTVIVHSIGSCGVAVPLWLNTATNYVNSVQVRRMFLFKGYLIEKEPLHTESANEAEILNENEFVSSSTKATSSWQLFAKIIDRILFIIISLVYLIMIINFLPDGYLIGSKRGDLTIVGF